MPAAWVAKTPWSTPKDNNREENRYHLRHSRRQLPVNRARIHIHFHTIKDILLLPHWVVFSLVGVFFFFFALDRGGTNVFIWSSGMFLLIHLLNGDYRIGNIPLCLRVLFAVAAIMVMMSLVFSYDQTGLDRIDRIVKMLIIIFSIHFIGRTETAKHASALFGLVMTISIIWQFLARALFALPYGTWSNPHYLANVAVLTLPLVFYYFRTVPTPYNILFAMLAVVDIDPVFRNASRPAFLALVVSSLFVVIFFTRSRYRWIGLLTLCGSLILLTITNYAGFFEKLKELILNVSHEERVTIWKYSWTMLQDNSPLDWFVGNGIGSTLEILPKYATPDTIYKSFSFPHNFFLQILFENGLIGSVLVFGGLAYLLYLFIKLSNTEVDPSMRLFINCMMVSYLNCLIFTGLTVGFYSKYTLYPLAFIIGTLFVMMEKVQNDS
jgi:O-antigen ligase